MRTNLLVYLIAVALAAAGAVRCSENAGPVPIVASISVAPDSISIETRQTTQLTAVLKDSTGRTIVGIQPNWSTADTTLATVSPTGSVLGVRVGVVWVYAAANGHTDSTRVSVLVPIVTLMVVPATVTLVKGATVRLSAIPVDSEGNYRFDRLTWTSSDTTKTVVVGGISCFDGLCAIASALDSGTVTITATAGQKQSSARLSQVVVSFTALTSAGDHTCGLANSGDVWCWGHNSLGQLAVPYPNLPRTTPGLVRGGLRFLQITAGGDHEEGFMCGVASTSIAYCWGGGAALGSLVPAPATIPTPVTGMNYFTAVSAGNAHACALDVGGAAYCWGSNGAHQLGTDTLQTSGAYNSIPVEGGLRFVSLYAGDAHTCALTTDRAAYCWGGNNRGQLGNDSPPPTSNYGPRLVQGGLSFVAITAGNAHTCGLTTSGSAYCWGRNDYGQLGTGDTVDRHAPVPVTGALTFRAIAAGTVNTCGIVTDGRAYCWGVNSQGQLGVGSASAGNDPNPAPLAVTGGLLFSSIETRRGETCGITTTGLAYCWGWNFYGQLGDGTLNMSTTPHLVVGQN
jgi:alpha-tubulin suppressor-like RCC1 family protein